MIGWHRHPLEPLREKYRQQGPQDREWAWYVHRDSDGMVHAAALLSGAVSTWASELIDDPRRWEIDRE